MNYVLRDFSPQALAQAIEANQVAFYADLGRSSQFELIDDLDILWFVTGIPSPRFNRVLRARFEATDVDERIAAALSPFRAQQVPMMWHTGPSTRPIDLGRHLAAHGLAHTESEPGMAADLLALGDDPPMPSGLEVTQVRDLSLLREWVNTFTHAFVLPDEEREFLTKVETELSLERDRPRRLYLGLMEGEPVATSALFLGAGVAGVYAVATVPRARRRGIGTALTAVPLLDARALGFRVATLHASPMGLGLYRRLGFREYCVLDRYVLAGE
jgi:ribosomal protein S18 acetylase RimI-like enzyme